MFCLDDDANFLILFVLETQWGLPLDKALFSKFNFTDEACTLRQNQVFIINNSPLFQAESGSLSPRGSIPISGIYSRVYRKAKKKDRNEGRARI